MKPSPLHSVVLLVGLLSLAATHPARAAEESAESLVRRADQLIDQRPQLLPLLGGPQRQAWVDAEAQVREAKALVRSGQFKLAQEESRFDPLRDIDKVRQEGQQEMARAREILQEAITTLAELREVARENQQEQETQAQEETTYTMQLSRGTWPQSSGEMVPSLLTQVWAEGYTRILFDTAFVRGQGLPKEAPGLAQEILDDLNRVDGTRYTVTKVDHLRIAAVNENPVLAFDGTETVLSGRKPAVILGELILSQNGADALFVLTAIDYNEWSLIAMEQEILPVTPALLDAAGLKRSEVLAAEGIPSEVTLTDSSELLVPLVRNRYVFRTEYIGNPDIVASLYHMRLAQSLLMEQDSLITATPIFFELLPKDDSALGIPPRKGEDAVWILQRDVDRVNDVETWALLARSLVNNRQIKVGEFSWNGALEPANPGESITGSQSDADAEGDESETAAVDNGGPSNEEG